MQKNITFEETQKIIEDFVIPYQDKDYGSQRKYKMKTSDAIFCAMDRARNRKFRNAIQQAIIDTKTTNIHVVDAGSGTGILGIYALIHGAQSCTFIEENPGTLALSKDCINKLGYQDKTNFIQADATQCALDKKYNILISETISADFQTEDFSNIIKNLSQYKANDAIQIPESCVLEIKELASGETIANTSTYELDLQKTVNLPKPQADTVSIIYQGTIQLYKDVRIKSGECMSFFNQRTIHI